MTGRRRLAAALTASLAGLSGLFVVVAAPPAGAFPGPTVDLVGHGFGHGRGMGQYGSLGYALKGVAYPEILKKYYGNTTAGNLSGVAGGADPMTIELTRLAPSVSAPAGS